MLLAPAWHVIAVFGVGAHRICALTGKLVPRGEFVVRRPAVFAKEPKTPAAAEYLGQASELRRCVLRALGLVEGGPLFGVGIARFPTALHRCAPLTLKKIADFLV